MTILFENESIEMTRVQQIYPAAIIHVPDEPGETTPISLEWLEEKGDAVVVAHYAIIVLYKDRTRHGFTYPDRESLEAGMGRLREAVGA